MTDGYDRSTVDGFYEMLVTGHIPAAVLYTDVVTGETSWEVQGLPLASDGIIPQLARSATKLDRAAAAVMTCTNVAKATEHEHATRRCVTLTPRTQRRPMRVFTLQRGVHRRPLVGFLRRTFQEEAH